MNDRYLVHGYLKEDNFPNVYKVKSIAYQNGKEHSVITDLGDIDTGKEYKVMERINYKDKNGDFLYIGCRVFDTVDNKFAFLTFFNSDVYISKHNSLEKLSYESAKLMVRVLDLKEDKKDYK